MRWSTWTGTRIVRPFSEIARPIAWRIQIVAYVLKRNPLRGANFSTARTRPNVPSWTRSDSVSPWSSRWKRLATWTTRRRLASTMRSLAARSPRSTRRARLSSSAGGRGAEPLGGGGQGGLADEREEEGEAVGHGRHSGGGFSRTSRMQGQGRI